MHWKGNTIYKKCQHKNLSKEERSCKPYLKLNSPAYKALKLVVLDKSLKGDLKFLTNFNHTGALEVYHALYNKFCPKHLHFSYKGMIARCGVGACQAKTKDGKLRFKQQFSKLNDS